MAQEEIDIGEGAWVEFDMVELEQAKRRRKDPRSFSEIFCFKKCLSGPSEKSTSPKIANAVNIIMLCFNILMASYGLDMTWQWLIYLNICFGLIAQVLMWCV